MRQENKLIMKARRRNIALTIAYDGTNYAGFQYQTPPVIAVQNVLEDVLTKMLGEKIEVAAAGRTDSGVHAYGQVVNFFTDCSIPTERLPLALSSYLPSDIAAVAAWEAEREFSARHSAVSKEYRYLIYNAALPSPFYANRALWVRNPLDMGLIEEGLSLLRGQHDFSAFRAAGGNQTSPIRTIMEAKAWAEELVTGGRLITISFHADGFLYHQVRNMVGMLVPVGLGRIAVERMQEIMEGRDRTAAPTTAAAAGLYLYKVHY